ncbi:MAG: MBL fold metallo-hydrolase [Lachnospiraceae bacterium]|nr:MBL fold metallo-hydrolase [Lachnospiraceae bacterium]
MRMKSIASGSSGNSIYIGSDKAHLLIDTGVSKKRIEEGLKELGLTGNDLSGILLTHEHSDHVQGLGVFLRKYQIPVYATQGTIDAVCRMKNLGVFDTSLLTPISNEERFTIGDIGVSAIKTSHDAADPVAYRFESGYSSAAVVTDLGEYNDYIVESLKGLSGVFIEANHDVRMLETGPYPYELKQRILGRKGHLSNEASGRLLSVLLNDKMKHVFLSHLSHENNMPELAFEAVRLEIEMSENEYHGDDFPIDIAYRDRPGMTVEV